MAEKKVPLGLLKLARLRALNASVRNCSLRRSVIWKLRWTPPSTLKNRGATRKFCPALPNVPAAVVVESTRQLGYPEAGIVAIGLVLLACTFLYLIPRTAILGAILLTGYLGGAVATHLRVSGSWFNILFPVSIGCMLWLGLWLRDKRLESLLPVSDSGWNAGLGKASNS